MQYLSVRRQKKCQRFKLNHLIHLGYLPVREGSSAEGSGIRVAQVCFYLRPFTGVSADSAQTPASGSWALEALPHSAFNEHPLVDDAKAEIHKALSLRR